MVRSTDSHRAFRGLRDYAPIDPPGSFEDLSVGPDVATALGAPDVVGAFPELFELFRRNPGKRSGRASAGRSQWRERYSEKHRPRKLRVPGQPGNRLGRVAFYERSDHLHLRWCEDGKSQWKRIEAPEGVDPLPLAIDEASRINARLADAPKRHVSWQPATVRKAAEGLRAAKEASDVKASSLRRYRARDEKILEFAEGTEAGRRCRHVHEVDDAFCREFVLWLDRCRSTANGGPASATNPGTPLSLNEKSNLRVRLRAILEHARTSVPRLVPEGWANPMTRELVGAKPRRAVRGPSAPPVTLEQVAALVPHLDAYGLALLAPVITFGMRPSEPGHLLREDIDLGARMLTLRSRPELGYATKSGADRYLPVTEAFLTCIRPLTDRCQAGPVFVRRAIFAGKRAPLAGMNAAALAGELARRRDELNRPPGKAESEKLAAALWRDAGAAAVRDVARELAAAARKAGLGRVPTPRDLRHLFATCCAEAGLGQEVTRLLMGHAPAAGDNLHVYTHVTPASLHEAVARLDERRGALIEVMVGRAAAAGD